MKNKTFLLVIVYLLLFLIFTDPVVRADNLATVDDLAAASYLVADLDSGEIFYSNHENELLPPASMTKLLTSLTLLSDPEFDVNKNVTFSDHAVNLPSPESVNAGYVIGESTTTFAAYNNMMIGSANDCARALAETYGGSEEGFLAMMNAKALEIGCNNTHFSDVCGFNSGDHYTTAEDLVKIIRANLEYPLFRETVEKKVYLAPATDVHQFDGWHLMLNTNQVENVANTLHSKYFESFGGGKTGTTGQAGDCLISTATTHDNHRLVAVVFDIGVNQNGEKYSYDRHVAVYRLLEAAALKLNSPKVDRESAVNSKIDSTENQSETFVTVEQEQKSNNVVTQYDKYIGFFSNKYFLTVFLAVTFILLLSNITLRFKLRRERQRGYMMYQRLKQFRER